MRTKPSNNVPGHLAPSRPCSLRERVLVSSRAAMIGLLALLLWSLPSVAQADTHTTSYSVSGDSESCDLHVGGNQCGGEYLSMSGYLLVDGVGGPGLTLTNYARNAHGWRSWPDLTLHEYAPLRTVVAGSSYIGHISVRSGSQLGEEFNNNGFDTLLGVTWGSTGSLTVHGELHEEIDGIDYYQPSWYRAGNVEEGGKTTVGVGGVGVFNVTGGGQALTTSLYLGSNSIGHGTVNVSGSGNADISRFSSGESFIGHSGTGVMNITNGGSFSSGGAAYIGTLEDSSGAATVSGLGSSLSAFGLVVGGDGLGSLVIQNGASAYGAYGFIGGSSQFFHDSTPDFLGTGFGYVTVTGEVDDSPSTWDVGSLYVGWNGMAELNIQNGGVVRSDVSDVGHEDIAYGDVTVHGEGSVWETSYGLNVGRSGFGAVTVLNGGLVIFDYGDIGSHSGGTGVVTIKGHGSEQRSEMLRTSEYIFFVGGEGGTAYLTIEDGGLLTSSGGTEVGGNYDSQGTVEVKGVSDGYRSTWLNNGSLTIGSYGNGSLAIEQGGLVTTGWIEIGGYYNAHGLVTVNGGLDEFRSTLDVSETLWVYSDEGGSGKLRVESGGLVNSTGLSYIDGWGGETSVTVKGTNDGLASTWNNQGALVVGDMGSGTLRIEDGGLVQNRGARIGDWEDSEGTVVVKGVSGNRRATWNNRGNNFPGQLIVGNEGIGTLNIEDGGLVQNAQARIGNQEGSSGVVSVHGTRGGFQSTWQNSGELAVGYEGAGTLNIEAGGLVTNTNGFVGRSNGSHGTAIVTGAGSEWINSGNLILGGTSLTNATSGVGTLTVGDGGSVEVGNMLRVHGGGTVNLQTGGTISTHHFNPTNGTFDFTGGTLEFTGVVTGDLYVPEFGTIAGTGTVVGDVYSSGTVAPGSSPGTLTIDGDFTQDADGQLLIEIAGLTAESDYDQLVVSGTATIDGTLSLRFLSGFAPSTGDTFDFLVANDLQVSNQLHVQIENLLPGFEYDFSFADGVYSLTALNDGEAASLPGDFDGDGDVDGRDFLLWQRGGSPTPLSATDLAGWQASYGTGSLVGIGGAELIGIGDDPARTLAVPEPSGLALGMLFSCSLVGVQLRIR